jgi:hypothetical protein
LAVLAVDAHQCIGHGAGRIRFEEVAAASIEKGVDRPLDLVVLLEKFITALLIAGQALAGFGVVTDDAQIERVAVEGDPEFRLFARRSAVVRIDLDKLGRDLCALPDCFVKTAVECDRLFGPKRLGRDGAPRLRRGWYQRLRENRQSSRVTRNEAIVIRDGSPIGPSDPLQPKTRPVLPDRR